MNTMPMDSESPDSGAEIDDVADIPTSELLEHAAIAENGSSVAELVLKKKYYSDGIRFIKELNSAINIIFQILFSSSKSEVASAIEFISLCILYKLVDKNATLKKLLHLIWSIEVIEGGVSSNVDSISSQNSIKEHLLNTFNQHLFVRDPTQSTTEWINQCTWGLLSFINENPLSISEFKSLEKILSQMMSKNYISQDVILLLWKIFENSNEYISFRRCAILLLSCLDLSFCHEKIPSLLAVGLDCKGNSFDFVLASQTLRLLLAIYSSGDGAPNSLPCGASLPTVISGIILRLIFYISSQDESGKVFELLQTAIRLIFKACSQPLDIFDELIRNIQHICSRLTDSKRRDTIIFPRVLFLLSQVCIQYATYLEFLEQNLTQKKSIKNDVDVSEERRVSLDLQNISLEEEIKERISYLRESEFLWDQKSFASHFLPIVAHLCTTIFECGEHGTSSHRGLFLSGIFSLSSMMMFSSKFCQLYLKLFVQLLLSPGIDSILRANLVIAFGDLVLIHGAHLDHSLKYLFETLADPSPLVRINAIIVISHLIINGIIKGKGSLADLCLCLVDDDPSIATLAKTFFSEFSAKDSSLFSTLPDIISCLSSDERIDAAKFRTIMRFLLNFIDKVLDFKWNLIFIGEAYRVCRGENMLAI